MAKVLLVDDADDLRLLLELRLRSSGHRVLSVHSGEDALAALVTRSVPDVAVVDLLMPGMSGFGLHARFREDPALAQMPVIFLSSRNQPGDVAAGEGLGAVYLTKPVDLDNLNRAIELVLRRDAGEFDPVGMAVDRLPGLIRVVTVKDGPGAERRQRLALSSGLPTLEGDWDDL